MVPYIFEMIILFIGVWALIAGRLPSLLKRGMFGLGYEYEVAPSQMRLIGGLFVLPIPVSSAYRYVIAATGREAMALNADQFELGLLLAVTVLGVIIARRYGKPEHFLEGQRD